MRPERPQTRLGGLLGDLDWAPLGTGGEPGLSQRQEESPSTNPQIGPLPAHTEHGSDGTRTRDLRRDRPAPRVWFLYLGAI
jgi:hypothetical protein